MDVRAPLSIYNSLSRKKQPLETLHPHKIKMYVCGPTVYDSPHIGHARSAYIFDVIRRYLGYKGYEVTFVRNVTDVDDKIIEKAKSVAMSQLPVPGLIERTKEIAERYLEEYHDAIAALGIGLPDKEPKATEYIPKMVKFIELLMDRGCAYEAGGDVYFDIKKARKYGKLSNQNAQMMDPGARIAPGERKKGPLDFALWKKAKEGEPSWPSPWGEGRPGWHIECSVMSSDILGDEFDIHGGGIDLIFPHHENEIAQSEGAGKAFARYWMHNGLLTINGEKMAKSAGNFITIKDFTAKHKDADYLKLLFLSGHYRSPVDYTEEKIDMMKREKERFVILMEKIERIVQRTAYSVRRTAKHSGKGLEDFRKKFEEAMDDDFNMPQGLGAMFELVNYANQNIDDIGFISEAGELLSEFAGIFGLDLIKTAADLSASVKALISRRDEARKKGDFGEADRIRKELLSQGIILEDTKEGTTWRRRI